MKNSVALFGNVALKRAYCTACKTNSLIVASKYTCCGKHCGAKPTIKQRISEPKWRRKKPSLAVQHKILELQNNRCIYCGSSFRITKYIKDDKIRIMKLVWDHFIPYAYSANNYHHNFVAACNVCNSIKASKMFETLDEAREYIAEKRINKNIRIIK